MRTTHLLKYTINKNYVFGIQRQLSYIVLNWPQKGHFRKKNKHTP